MNYLNKILVAVKYSGGSFGSPKYMISISKDADIIYFECKRDNIKVGGGGHGIDSFNIIDNHLKQLQFTEFDDSSVRCNVIDGLCINCEISTEHFTIITEYYHEPPKELFPVRDIADTLWLWGKRYFGVEYPIDSCVDMRNRVIVE